MGNYSDNPGSVRVDFFKPGGEWGYTKAIDMSEVWDEPDLFDAVRRAIVVHCNGRMMGMTAVVLDPYHPNSHPMMLKL